MDSSHGDIEQYALDNDVPIMHKDGILFLVETIKRYHVLKILELGSAIGYSAIKMAELNSDIRITTIEKDLKRYEEAVKNINAFNLHEQITIVHMDAYDYVTDERFDLIFLDAAKSQYQGLFDRFVGNLAADGHIVVDNLAFHRMVDHPELTTNRNTKGLVRKIKKFRDGILSNPLYHASYFPEIGDGIALIGLK